MTDKYIEFINIMDNVDFMVEIIDEDDEYIYFYNETGRKTKIEKNRQNVDFEFIESDRYQDYISPWDDDIIDDDYWSEV